jgi:hypothetical protein
MDPAADLQPFFRRQRTIFRIDAVLHALFLIPIFTLIQSRFSWSDTDTRRPTFWEGLSIGVEGWFVLLALMGDQRSSQFRSRGSDGAAPAGAGCFLVERSGGLRRTVTSGEIRDARMTG